MTDKDKYIKSAAVLVWFTTTNSEPKLMLSKRLPSCKRFVGRWGAAGGRVDKGECIITAAQRELYEETSLYVPKSDLRLIDSHYEDEFKCFVFSVEIGAYRFSDVKNPEPKKHTKWELFTAKEALKLPNLMPRFTEYCRIPRLDIL